VLKQLTWLILNHFMILFSHFVKTSCYFHSDMCLAFSYIFVSHFIVCQPFHVLAAISCYLSHFYVVSVILCCYNHFMLCQSIHIVLVISCCISHSIFYQSFYIFCLIHFMCASHFISFSVISYILC
jgi:hypothetical protein